jgi:hypothetical protein
MVDSSSYLDVLTQLTPRQDRIEDALVRALASGATRSTLREIVHEYTDLQRLQGIAPEQIVASLTLLVRRAAPRMRAHEDSLAGDSPEERSMLIVRWCSARCYRLDLAGRSEGGEGLAPT